ncbi:MAG: ribbon-helix-helix protein, CopG family [Armatimonadetes bacterium]|nr:ribbon-helix-helix protein, CopG family [Armatimonadota bacterium]
MSQVVTLRLPDETAEAVRQAARRERRSLNEVGVRIIDEWVRQGRFAHIEFRTIDCERQACIKDCLEVWQVIMLARTVSMDPERTATYLGLSREQAQAALTYYAAYPDDIDRALAENDLGYARLRETLPGIQLVEAAPPRDE